MSQLLLRPNGTNGKVHEVTPKNAGWGYVGFSLYRLKPGEIVTEATGDMEAILVLVEGKARISVERTNFGVLGNRMNVFDEGMPASAYVPNNKHWAATAETDCTLAVCSAPAIGSYPARVIETTERLTRGTGTNTRYVHPIAMEDKDVAGSLLVTEVFTPAGNWSSYPSHRHDEDDFPNMTYLEETYYHRLDPAQGFAFQRVYTEDGSLDETMTVQDHDVVLVPKGHHPCGAPHGYGLYYLNVMAGPMRKWRFKNDPAHDWIAKRDAG